MDLLKFIIPQGFIQEKMVCRECALSIGFDDDHFYLPNTGLCVQRWLNMYICARNVSLQFRQGMLPASSAAFITLVFLASLFCSVEDGCCMVVFSYIFKPLKMEVRHCGLSRAICSQESWVMLNAFDEALKEVEVVQLSSILAVHSPGFASIQHGWYHHATAYH